MICGEAGRCENAIGSFNCRCEDGFSVRPEMGPECRDEDECLMGNFNCAPNAECVNTEVTPLFTDVPSPKRVFKPLHKDKELVS